MLFFLPDSFVLCKNTSNKPKNDLSFSLSLSLSFSQDFPILIIYSIIRSYVRDGKMPVPHEVYFSRSVGYENQS